MFIRNMLLLLIYLMLIVNDVKLLFILYFKYASLTRQHKTIQHETRSIERRFKESKLIKQKMNHVLIYWLINWYWTTSFFSLALSNLCFFSFASTNSTFSIWNLACSLSLSYTTLSLPRAPSCTLLQITSAHLKGARDALHKQTPRWDADEREKKKKRKDNNRFCKKPLGRHRKKNDLV